MTASVKPTPAEYLEQRIGQVWTHADSEWILAHLRQVEKLACELVERARKHTPVRPPCVHGKHALYCLQCNNYASKVCQKCRGTRVYHDDSGGNVGVEIECPFCGESCAPEDHA